MRSQLTKTHARTPRLKIQFHVRKCEHVYVYAHTPGQLQLGVGKPASGILKQNMTILCPDEHRERGLRELLSKDLTK